MTPPAPDDALLAMRAAMERELVDRLLPFWMHTAIDDHNGGFVGAIDGDGTPDWNAPKGSILNARILWTFSAAYRVLGDERLRQAADRALQYFVSHFADPVFGGVFWMVDAAGRPIDERKHVYAQAFAIYGLSEYHRATGDDPSLRDAIALFRLVEAHAHDRTHGGYEEAFSNTWALLDDVRLSEVDANERKSMNTHLHLLEAYTNLLRVWSDDQLRERVAELIVLFVDRIVNDERGSLIGFFDADWTPKFGAISYGHDIEASWLLVEAAEVLGDAPIRMRAIRAANRLAEAVLATGVDSSGGVFTDRRDGVLDTDKEWWPQAEGIVGLLAAHERTASPAFADAAVATWDFVERHMRDLEHGEWHRRVSREGERRAGWEKVGPWKCPYHDVRACLEVMTRVVAPAVSVSAVPTIAISALPTSRAT